MSSMRVADSITPVSVESKMIHIDCIDIAAAVDL